MEGKNFGMLSLAAIVLAAGLLPASCGEKAKPASPDMKTAGLRISIIPENPKAEDAIKAALYGAGGDAAYRWELNGDEIPGVTGDALPKGIVRRGDTVKVNVISGDREASAEVTVANTHPRLRSVEIRPARFSLGTDLAAAVDGFDPDDDYVNYDYLWSLNGERVYTATGPILDGGAYKRGDKITLRVVPRDSEGAGEPIDAEAGYAVNSPPVFVSAPPKDFAGSFIYSVETSDPDGDAVKLALEKSPEGMRIEGSKVMWDASGAKGSFEVVLAADDGNGGRALQEFELTLRRD